MVNLGNANLPYDGPSISVDEVRPVWHDPVLSRHELNKKLRLLMSSKGLHELAIPLFYFDVNSHSFPEFYVEVPEPLPRQDVVFPFDNFCMIFSDGNSENLMWIRSVSDGYVGYVAYSPIGTMGGFLCAHIGLDDATVCDDHAMSICSTYYLIDDQSSFGCTRLPLPDLLASNLFVTVALKALSMIQSHVIVEETSDFRKKSRRGMPMNDVEKSRHMVRSKYVVLDRKLVISRWRSDSANAGKVNPHIRRAHLRRLSSGKVVRVRSCQVHASEVTWREQGRVYRICNIVGDGHVSER